jgi:hypothetical protein
MRAPIVLLAALLVPIAVPRAHAGARFNGPVKFEFVNDHTSVAITTGLIENTSREDATGTLQVQFWATAKRYEGGTIDGDQLAAYKLEGLAPAGFYKDRREVALFTPPAKWGTYAISLLLLEYKGGAYTVVSHVNLPGPVKLGQFSEIVMEGPFRWQTSYEGGTMDIGIGKIAHRRKGTTGSLRIAVWASEEPYDGGLLHGHELGSVIKNGLQPGFEYKDFKNVAKFTPPPGGTYHIVFALSELNDKREYRIVDYYNQPDTVAFPAVKR